MVRISQLSQRERVAESDTAATFLGSQAGVISLLRGQVRTLKQLSSVRILKIKIKTLLR